MFIGEVLEQFETKKLVYIKANIESGVKSKLAVDQIQLFLPKSWEAIFIFEFANARDLIGEKDIILKKVKKRDLDHNFDWFIAVNVFIVYSKNNPGRTETLKLLNEIFE